MSSPAPPMAFREFERLSPNRDAAAHERLGALFHHSELGFAETVARMLDPESRVSYHCLIDLDGTRCALVPDAQVAWHAGVSRFLGRDRCNDFLLGVAFAGDTYRAPLSVQQIASARMLDPESRVSYHCLIDLDGTRCALVPDAQVAWHAGVSRFLGRDRCNDFLLGVAFAGDI